MNKPPAKMTDRGGAAHRLRRFPHLTEPDRRMLEQLTPTQAREMENLILTQARSDARYRAHHATVTVTTTTTGIDLLSAIRELSMRTTGGGRQRTHLPVAP